MASSTDPFPGWTISSRLWLVLDQAACAPRNPLEVARACISGGVDAVLCRLRIADHERELGLASPVRALCSSLRIPFIVSHDEQLACALSADAVQYGRADGSPLEIAVRLGQGRVFGYSCHGVNEAAEALEAGAAWVFLGPIFATPEKMMYGQPLGLDALRESMLLASARRIVHIGGINARTIAGAVQAGAGRVAAIAALQSVHDPESAARTLLQALQSREG